MQSRNMGIMVLGLIQQQSFYSHYKGQAVLACTPRRDAKVLVISVIYTITVPVRNAYMFSGLLMHHKCLPAILASIRGMFPNPQYY